MIFKVFTIAEVPKFTRNFSNGRKFSGVKAVSFSFSQHILLTLIHFYWLTIQELTFFDNNTYALRQISKETCKELILTIYIQSRLGFCHGTSMSSIFQIIIWNFELVVSRGPTQNKIWASFPILKPWHKWIPFNQFQCAEDLFLPHSKKPFAYSAIK